MLRRVLYLLYAFAMALVMALPISAQVVRFETTAGNFDLVMNPTDNPALQNYVNNFLHYVNNNSYKASWINRADTGFVMQMGGFYSHTTRPPLTIDSTRPVATVAPVAGVPASLIGLSNTLGTVSLALPGNGQGGTDQNAGTSSFFVNLTSNTFLDSDFTVFAAVADLTTVNDIMGLQTIDRTQDPEFGADSGNLGFTKVPVMADGKQVFVKRAFEIDDTLTVAREKAAVQAIMSQSASSFGSGGGASPILSSPDLSTGVVPEPSTWVLAIAGAGGLSWLARRRRG